MEKKEQSNVLLKINTEIIKNFPSYPLPKYTLDFLNIV